jgi:hypothetical protein
MRPRNSHELWTLVDFERVDNVCNLRGDERERKQGYHYGDESLSFGVLAFRIIVSHMTFST